MAVKLVDATISSFGSVFEKFKAEAPKTKLISSFSWLIMTLLPNSVDCVRAEPVILKKLEALPDDVALLRAYHPWRVDSRFKLTGVPTLISWENDAVKGRLEDYEAHLEPKINALVSGN
ncbi:nuclear envelope integral membrane protein [Salix suchowensis]|nr:nuclear envelope integral membrane protein [Salix suchowensis]